MKKALIIGVSGQDGAYLSQLLLKKGYQVFGTSRDAQLTSFHNLETLNIRDKVELLSVSLKDFRSILNAIESVDPDEIYHLAGQSSVALSFQEPVETLESNIIGVLNVLEALRYQEKQIKFYNACSSEAFGDTAGKPATEETPFRPRSPYAVAKAAAFWETSNYREAYDLFACSGILFNHESPLRPSRFVTQKIITGVHNIATHKKDKLNLGNLDIVRDWGWAPEYIEAMWLMLQQERPEDYVVATGTSHSLRDFVRLAFETVNLDYKDYIVTDDALLRPTEIMVSRGNPGKAQEKLGWKSTVTLKKIIKNMMDNIVDE